ncbi:glycosyltransferase family 2 protein [Paracoccus denitrificans]|uniref:glycosyltransferase family 2 protein n=1 Tax=Paracoccus denitrificans TaxID=266 RepID=UPI000CECA688|nr:glycosyltransferase family A protein [Paracoccus denitrificans]
MKPPAASRSGIVVIGRNEGARLVACLESLGDMAARSVYVDSGSTDGSVEKAQAMGALTVRLDMSVPFTAARARNAGFAALEQAIPNVDYVQFVDGDCTLDCAWLSVAEAFLQAHQDMAVVCGRRRERYPQRSVYNRLCDLEWDTPIGEATECGGDALIRVAAFRDVGGYAEDLIAGEEPEMCVRLRSQSWRIWRLDAEMTLHDANMLHFGQWWRRAMRAGHAFAEVAARHATSPFGIWKRNVRRALLWGGALPAIILLAAILIHPALLLLFLIYPAQIARIALRSGSRNRDGWVYAGFAVLAKFPEMQGAARFYINRVLKRANTLIEYK